MGGKEREYTRKGKDFCLDQQERQWTEGMAQILLGVPGSGHQDGMS